MDEKALKEFMAENQDAMKKAAADAILEKIKQDISWRMPDVVQTAVNEFMEDEIVPAVVKVLKSEKIGIIASAAKAASEIGDHLSKTMIENAVKNVEGYRGGDIIKKLFE